MMNIIQERRSIRTFEKNPIDDAIIHELLKSAMQAPSARNQQPWAFIVIKNRNILDQLSKVSNGARHLKNAPLAILTLMKETEHAPHMRPQDMAAATQNILLEAHQQGLGAVWIGVYPLEERIQNVKNIVTISSDETPFSLIALGYPLNRVETPSLRFDSTRVTVIE